MVFKSTIIRRLRPTSLWISIVRPDLPFTSRRYRLSVAQGNMPYSAVIHPCPESFKKGGTDSSTDTPHITWVFPIFIKIEPSA
ncbi:hypothetical protein DGMP_22310 [Desulfomarina profundi]|uniref:Uncharacterized protein n=1 Tax=Desulfomarina profundi TaxID=2772557 RepID=A0A8D5FM41_9BACT|nr:hypothetical protein DGMP_22310 [Desulfomarina profundi]